MTAHPLPRTFRGPASSRRAALAALVDQGHERRRPRRVEVRVLDSFDGRLHDAGLRLAEMTSSGSTALHLTGDGVVPLLLPSDGATATAADFPVGPVRDRLADLLDVRTLLVQAQITATVTETERLDEAGKTIGRARLIERIAVTPGPHATTIAADEPVGWLLEVDAVTGYEKTVRRAVDALDALDLVAADAPWVDVVRCAAGIVIEGHRHSPTVDLDPAAPILASTRVVLANLAVTAVANWRPTLEDLDPEFLHDLRVALRRTRSVLKDTTDVLPSTIGAEARQQFRDIARATGDARDLDVYLVEWPTYVGDLPAEVAGALAPARVLLAEQRLTAYVALRSVLGADATTAWMSRWQSWLETPVTDDDRGKDQHQPTGRYVAQRISRAHHHLVRDGRAITEHSPAEQLHELRKDAKRLRYLVECFGGVFDPEARAPFVKRLKRLQENLGEHQDAEVHVTHLHQLSRQLNERAVDPATLVALGQLAEQLDQRRQTARVEFADRFADFDRPATDQRLDDMLAGSDR